MDEALRQKRREAGRKGGLVKGRKGIATKTFEERRIFALKGVAARQAKKNG